MSKTASTQINKAFQTQLEEYQQLIDADIEQYCEQLLEQAHEGFGEYPTLAVQAYCDILRRGGKRIRGALTMTAYYMLGGQEEQVALQAARATEMLHAYILIADDIQDNSDVRRGGPTAHIALADYHRKQHLKGDSEHFGRSIAINSLLFGAHAAMNVLAQIPVADERKVAAMMNVNTHFIATAHGQTMDIFNEVTETTGEVDVEKVLLWKTAFYTIMNPLQLGAILAGGTEQDLDLLKQYSLHAGRVFQITDDIIGMFGTEQKTGKNPLDDVREGKRTLLIVHTLENAPKADAYFIEQMLGNQELTTAEFARVKEIVTKSGALGYSREQTQKSRDDAQKPLQKTPKTWQPKHKQFLSDLAGYLTDRNN